MTDALVTRATKSVGTHEGITHLGGETWTWTIAQVIESIENGTNTFHTSVGGKAAYVGVVQGTYRKYVQTHADGSYNNNLLALPPCN
jgi:Protein of unknown function (DUF3892)